MTLTTVAPVITDAGPIAPTYYEIVDYLKTKYKGIYGEDAYLENDSQDGQWIGVFSRAVADVNAVILDVYATFSPKTAKNDALSRNVAINGIARQLPTYSTVDLEVTGISGTEITKGYALDRNGNQWMFPDLVTIPASGTIVVTAKAKKPGAILALSNTITIIGKPTRGWKGVNNPASSSLGMPVESDAKLRQRQALSVAIPSQSKTDSIKGGIFSLDGVSRCKTYENDSDKVNELGLPPHSLCVVVSGGDANEIAGIMRAKKSLGCGWYGNLNVTVINAFGEEESVALYRPEIINIGFALNVIGSSEYTKEIENNIKSNLADYVNQLDIGDRIMINKLYIPAGLFGNLYSETYQIDSIEIIANGVTIEGNYNLAFNAVAYCDSDNIEINTYGGP
ncbi:baseplate J/gp47 family protein [Acinetobacter nosocomialis]|uniref:baseplate J/gp47 family protein n=1 Tax=Acinetobacter nosocomialis TaxID=106654 RepID=UPI00237E5354|nr:baseplate J/gp47 family protein [Acinetobacter nosocomialis]MDE1703238.1 baseplate J/gp47 family protein [Acinetobacter nosocomialis]HDG7211747.1 baseplate J/gp47 family protein [Acinetobacter nosocomialis]